MSRRDDDRGPCPFEDDVLAIPDGVLDPTRRLVVEAHLAVCDSCAEIEATLDRARRTLRNERVPPLGAVERALETLPPAPAMRPSLRWAAATTAVACAAALLATRWVGRGADDVRPASAIVPPARPERAAQAPADASAGTEPAVESATVPSPEGPPPSFVPRSLADLPQLVAEIDPDAPAEDAAIALAVRRVRSAGTAGAVALAAILESGEPDAVRKALRVARETPSAQFVAPLGRILSDSACDRALGAEAARLLARLETAAAVGELERALDGACRADALRALASTRSPRAFDVLASRARSGADDDPRDVLAAAVDASPLEAARLLVEMSASRDLAAAARDTVRARGPDLLAGLERLAARGDDLLAAAAVLALGDTGRSEAVPAVRGAASRFALARPAAEALVALGAFEDAFDVASDPRTPRDVLQVFDGRGGAVPALARSLADERPGRRVAAVEALGRTGSADAVPFLEPAAADPALRRHAIVALGRAGGDRAAAVLAELVRSNPRATDVSIARALGWTGSADAVPALSALARDPALAVVAAEALGGIPHDDAVLALADLLAEPRTARAAAESLGGLPARVVVPALLGRLDEPSPASARAHRALVLVAGADLGRVPSAWREWWDRRATAPSFPEESR